MARLHVGIDARLLTGLWGGIEQVVIGLASGLSKLEDGDEQYKFLVYGDSTEWLRPYLAGPCSLLPGPPTPLDIRLTQNPTLRPILPVARQAWYRWQALRKSGAISGSDGTIERANLNIMHFTIQAAFLTAVPSIYHPHDLQHLHLPQFFTEQQRVYREMTYRAFCAQARMIAVTSSWGKRDLMAQYNLPEAKVNVIPWAPVLNAYPDPTDTELRTVQRKFSLPAEFIFYPAQTWPHKNHIALLEALALLRDRYNVAIPFVSSGQLNEFFPQIERRVRELGLGDQAHFLGFVSPLELRCLYKLCRAIVIPTKFEAGSFPLWEAFLSDIPVACSNVTSLPEQARDGALIFDPENRMMIAEAIVELWTDEAVRQRLVEAGRRNVARFTWDRTARTFRAHYRRIANYALTDEDEALLSIPALL